jgi:UDP-N-acetylbacillosamine N-acetyltransferase
VVRGKLVIWGAASHALVVADIVRRQGEYEIAGFIDDLNPERAGTEFCGAPILGGREQFAGLLSAGVQHLLVGVGDCAARLRLAAWAQAQGCILATALHPTAVIADGVPVGAGTVMMAGAVANPGARIGANVIVNTLASVGHECVVEDGVHISAGVRLGGGVTVARGARVELSVTVAAHVRIGAGATIGAGALVLHDIPDGMLAYGMPARVIRKVEGHGS